MILFEADLMWPCLTIHKVVLLHPLHVLVLLQVLTHLYVLRVGLEIRVGCSCCLVHLLQLNTHTHRERESISVPKLIWLNSLISIIPVHL